ncbi:hypothetical protein [Vampirovibrio sp.]|uniref:hypothetical protein n=1 Tax=Vampirovibrio sp. TaxID=2717857 RepID=UPI003593C10F
MSEPAPKGSPAHPLPHRLDCWAILGRAISLYSAHWQAFTRVLLWPVLQIGLGVYISQTLSLLVITISEPILHDYWWLILGGLLLMVGFGLFLMFRGAWQYAVYWASLCRNAWEADQGLPLDFKNAYQNIVREKKAGYLTLSGTYFSLPLLTFMPVLLFSLLGSMVGPSALEVLFLAGFLQSLLLMAVWLFSLVPLSFVFQIAAFEKGIPINPLPIFRLSLKLTLKRFWSVLSLQMLVFLMTNCLIPQPLIWLARFTHAITPLDWIHQQLIQTLLSGNPSLWREMPWPGGSMLSDPSITQMLVHTLSDLCLSTFITLLLLPLGTFIFTLLYKDILKCDRSKKTWVGI